MTEPRRYEYDKEAAALLAKNLKDLPDKWVVCRDVRHAWAVENDFHVIPQVTEGRKLKHIARDLVCMRCTTIRHETYIQSKTGLEKVGQSYSYPEGYQIPGVPRGVKPSHIVQAEQFRRAMQKVAHAAAGDRDTAER